MPDIYKARWDFITKMFEKIKVYVENPLCKVEIEECEITHLEINDLRIYSKLDEHCTGLWAENDKECDHGLYRSIPEWEKWFDDNVRIYTVTPIKWK